MSQQRSSKMKSKRQVKGKDTVNIELQMKCCCSESSSHEHDFIQFAHRYLQCQSSMPVRILRRFIETILPFCPKSKISIFDANDRLLKESNRLRSLKHIRTTSNHIPLRFVLVNSITSLAHCSCLSPPMDHDSSLSSTPSIIQQETIDQILSTCEFPEKLASCPSSPLLTTSSYTTEVNPDDSTSVSNEICPSLATTIDLNFSSDIPLDLTFRLESVY